MEDSHTLARKILSCVARVRERFGAAHVASILHGGNTEKIRQFGHDTLSTYGLLKEFSQKDIQLWIEQLAYQDFLIRDPHYGTLCLTSFGKRLLRGDAPDESHSSQSAQENSSLPENRRLTVTLARPIKPKRELKESGRKLKQHGAGPGRPNTPQEAALLEELRRLRRRLSLEQRVPAYIIFSDVTLLHMAQAKPQSLDAFRRIPGVGEVKLKTLGPLFLETILNYLGTHPLPVSEGG